MPDKAVDAPSRARVAAWNYGFWGLVGALLGLGIIGILTIGIAFLVPGLALAVVGILIPTLKNRSAFAVVGGLAAAPLYLAWLNRGGPGEVCSAVGTGTSCVDEWSPWPFVVVAVALVLGLVLLVRRGPRLS